MHIEVEAILINVRIALVNDRQYMYHFEDFKMIQYNSLIII